MVGVSLQVRTDGRIAAPGEAGEIAISSPGCMLGYLDAPEQTAEVLQGGWVLTGDIGYLDEAGFVHVLDRAKFAFTSGGRTVYPHVVEQELTQHQAVQRASVVGVPRGDDTEICAALVAPGAQLTVDDVRPLFEGRPVPVPHRIVVVDALPLTAADKVDRAAVRALFG
jgi:acyl-CoA synthetase (AMP-forming)/AMP-acid ligase II